MSGVGRITWLALLAVLITSPAARAEAPALTAEQRATLLAEAQAAYDRGTSVLRTSPDAAREAFREAAARFQQLVDDGVVNGTLEYNLGNALLQSGRVGPAILHYRRAERLIPGDPRLEHNLAHARSLRRNQIARSGDRALADALLGWHERTPLATRQLVFTAAWLAFWLALVALRLRPGPGWRWVVAVSAVLWLPAGVSVAFDAFGTGTRIGVVVVDDVVARKGNGEGFEPQFAERLHQGVEFQLLAERGGWLRIELADGQTGWIRASEAEVV